MTLWHNDSSEQWPIWVSLKHWSITHTQWDYVFFLGFKNTQAYSGFLYSDSTVWLETVWVSVNQFPNTFQGKTELDCTAHSLQEHWARVLISGGASCLCFWKHRQEHSLGLYALKQHSLLWIIVFLEKRSNFTHIPSSPNYTVIIQSVDGWLLTHDWKPKNTISQLFCISQNRSPSVLFCILSPCAQNWSHDQSRGLRSRPCLSSVNNKEEKVKHCPLKTSKIPTLSRNPQILAKIFWRKPKMNLAALKWCRNTQ